MWNKFLKNNKYPDFCGINFKFFQKAFYLAKNCLQIEIS